MVEVGKKERRFVGPELCNKSPGLSKEFFLSLAYFRRKSVKDAAVWDGC